jgi:hypothetical protein
MVMGWAQVARATFVAIVDLTTSSPVEFLATLDAAALGALMCACPPTLAAKIRLSGRS